MSALKRRKVSESFTEEKKQPKPSKKTLDRIDDTEVNQTSSQPLSQVAQEKSLKKRKLENEEADEGVEEKEEKVEEAEEAEEAKKKKKSFEDLGIIPELAQACESLGYKHPTPIQQEAIPLALQGRDLIGLAETGSGKTAAFALPILQSLMEKPSPLFGLVIAPTRELAYQISEQFEALGSLISVRTAVIVGGMDMVSQSIALGKKPHILIATPGRLLDHLENTKGFSLRTLKWLVLDEADRLLDLDFGEIISKILKNIPSERRTMLFSATISSKVEHLQRASLSNPLRVSISSSSYATVKTLMQSYIFIPHKFKDTYLVYLLNEHAGQSCILFTRTVNETARLAFLLRALGFSALPLHGQLSQTQRLGALNKFRAGGREIMVATDVAARGLDIPSVDLVINFDLPPDSKTYVHRVGRTARAGKAGVAISLVTQYDVEIYQRIEKALDKKLPEHHAPRDEVLIFSEKVAEAQRVAIREMKDMHEKAKGKGGPRAFKGKGNRRDGMDKDEG